jgi:hypothetical protein
MPISSAGYKPAVSIGETYENRGESVNCLGAQASLPACFGQSVNTGNHAGKDACAPRQFALPFSEEKTCA